MKLDVFFKGVLMGICDLVPGISGGTIAFVTGIYERLINCVSLVLNFFVLSEILLISFSFNLKKIDAVYKKYDLYFLFSLLFGILLAIILGSRLVVYLLDSFFVFTMSFFIGLILASAFLIFREIDDHKFSDRIFCFFGFVFGLLLLFLVPASVDVGFFYVFLSGFLGISAMFLPGISGSYILYLMGSYGFMLSAVNEFSITFILIFLIGAVFGAFVISRFIFFLLKNYHSKTLYVLFGFVLGALFVPLKDVFLVGVIGFDYLVVLILFLIGFISVFVVSKVGRNV